MSVSLVIPTLGQRAGYLRACVGSILDTDVDLAVGIVAPAERCAEISRAFPQIQVFAQQGQGPAAAIAEGWSHLRRSTYLAWLGDDDMLTHGSLRAALAALDANPSASMAYGQSLFIDEMGRGVYLARPGRQAQPILRLGKNLIAQPGCVYRTSAVDGVGGLDTSLRLAFDVDLHRRLLNVGRATYLPRTLGLAREHPTALTVANEVDSRAEADLALLRRMRWTHGRQARRTLGYRLGGLSTRLTRRVL